MDQQFDSSLPSDKQLIFLSQTDKLKAEIQFVKDVEQQQFRVSTQFVQFIKTNTHMLNSQLPGIKYLIKISSSQKNDSYLKDILIYNQLKLGKQRTKSQDNHIHYIQELFESKEYQKILQEYSKLSFDNEFLHSSYNITQKEERKRFKKWNKLKPKQSTENILKYFIPQKQSIVKQYEQSSNSLNLKISSSFTQYQQQSYQSYLTYEYSQPDQTIYKQSLYNNSNQSQHKQLAQIPQIISKQQSFHRPKWKKKNIQLNQTDLLQTDNIIKGFQQYMIREQKSDKWNKIKGLLGSLKDVII